MNLNHALACPAYTAKNMYSQKRLCECGAFNSVSNDFILVTCDLDSTLCDTGHRQKMIDREKGTDWAQYSLQCDEDGPVKGIVKVLQLLAMNKSILIVGLSARMAVAEEKTLAWMHRHGVPIEQVFLDTGEVKDYHPGWTHADYKLARLRQVEEILGAKVALHFDDYAEVADLFNREGVPTVCVRTPQEIEEILQSDHALRVAK